MTTWYWLSCVYVVDTNRWPKASYSASSIVCIVMPSRAAASRSTVTVGFQSRVLLIAADVDEAVGSVRSLLRTFGPHSFSSFEIVALERVLVLRAARPAADPQILDRLQVQAWRRECRPACCACGRSRRRRWPGENS